MLYLFTSQDEMKSRPAPEGLTIKEICDPSLLSEINAISIEEVKNRISNRNKAYVAFLNNIPAAFGWVATGKAKIGELNHEFEVPSGHAYLWNFRTLAAFRKLGIYTCLLQYILRSEINKINYFWILHAPENSASKGGILNAGFTYIGKTSLDHDNKVIFETDNNIEEFVQNTFGFVRSFSEQATCWNCSSPFLKNRTTGCCCSTINNTCNGTYNR